MNERYNFISETKNIIDNLNKFDNKGINLEINYNFIDSIMANSFINEGLKDTNINNNYNESIINTKGNNISTLENKSININFNNNKHTNILETSLFKIKENKDITDSLHLTPISFLYKQTKNIFITYEDDDLDLDNNNDPFNTVSNISNLFSPKFKLLDINKNNNIYSKKTINSNRDNETKSEYFISFKKRKMSKSQNNFYDLAHKINLLTFKENQKVKRNYLALSGNIPHKTLYNINSNKNTNIDQSFKTILNPRFEKVKTSDIVFLGGNKNKKQTVYKHQNTTHKLPMSPQLKSVYNIISDDTIKNWEEMINNIPKSLIYSCYLNLLFLYSLKKKYLYMILLIKSIKKEKNL